MSERVRSAVLGDLSAVMSEVARLERDLALALDKRDALIRRAYGERCTPAEIRAVTTLTRGRIHQIVKAG